MKSKGFNLRLFLYEVRNIKGNIFVIIFGIFFPIIMSIISVKVFLKEVPDEMMAEAVARVFITMSIVIPMATVFIGYAATFSQEIENKIPMRMRIFGYSEKSLLLAKMAANLFFLTIGLIIYTVADFAFIGIPMPSPSAACILILSLYALSVVFFVLAHGLALIFRKFGPTYAVTMVFYFGSMILCGMFGSMPSQFPRPLQFFAYLLPMSYMSEDFADFWKGGSYNFVPFIQAFLFFAAISCIILVLAIRKNDRKM
jgi:ABC-2 type transport system permease protein